MENPKTIKARLSVLRKAQSQHPKLFAQVADYLIILGQLKAAAKVLNKGLKQFPDYPTAWIVKGNLHLMLNEPEKARAALKRSLELDPDIPYSHKRCSELAADKNDHVDIVRHLQQLHKLDPLEDNIQVMLQTHILRRIAVEKGIFSEDEVNRLMPGTLRETMIKHNLMPAELARYSRRWSVPRKTEKLGDETVLEPESPQSFQEFEAESDGIEEFDQPDIDESTEDELREEQFEDSSAEEDIAESEPEPEQELEPEADESSQLESDWLGATPSEPSFEEEAVEDEQAEAEEEAEPHQKVSWADTVAGDVKSSLLDVDVSENAESEDPDSVAAVDEPIESISQNEIEENAQDTEIPPEIEESIDRTSHVDVEDVIMKQTEPSLGEAQPETQPEDMQSIPPGEDEILVKPDLETGSYDAGSEMQINEFPEIQIEKLPGKVEPPPQPVEGIIEQETTPGVPSEPVESEEEFTEEVTEQPAPKPVLDLGSDFFNETEEKASYETPDEDKPVQDDETGLNAGESTLADSDDFTFTPRNEVAASEETGEEPVLEEPQDKKPPVQKDEEDSQAGQDVILKLLRNNQRETEARQVINIEHGAPSEFENGDAESEVDEPGEEKIRTVPELESTKSLIMESEDGEDEITSVKEDTTTRPESNGEPDQQDEAHRELKEVAAKVVPASPENGSQSTSSEPKPKRIATKTLAELYASQGDWLRAVEVYEELLERHPTNIAYQQRLSDLKSRLEKGTEN